MKREAHATTIEGEHALVYEGFLTRLFNQLELATPYYTSVMQRLRKMGCVRQLSRGGGNAPSRWELIKDPAWDDFDVAEQRRLREVTKLGQLQGQVASLNTRVAALEEMMDRLLGQEQAS
jgi:uncharacterized protein YceH (UPF0502 family)